MNDQLNNHFCLKTTLSQERMETTMFVLLGLPHFLAMVYDNRGGHLLKIRIVIHALVIWNWKWEILVYSECFLDHGYLNMTCHLSPNIIKLFTFLKKDDYIRYGEWYFDIRRQGKEIEKWHSELYTMFQLISIFLRNYDALIFSQIFR